MTATFSFANRAFASWPVLTAILLAGGIAISLLNLA